MLIVKDDLYLRYDFGPSGGGLISFNFNTGECKKLFEKTAVTDMALDSKDRVWFTHQDSEGGIVHSALSMIDSGKLTTPLNEKTTDPSIYVCLAIKDDESVLIGTLDKGILKYQDGKVIKLTPDWNAKSFITSILPLPNDGFCFFSSGHGVIVSSNIVDEKLRSANSTNLFRLNMKKYFFQTDGNKKYFEDIAILMEKSGRFAQAAAFYILASKDYSHEVDDNGAERMVAFAQRAISSAPKELLNPFVLELFALSSSDHLKSQKFRKYLCQTVLNLYKFEKIPEDKTSESALALMKTFPEDKPLVITKEKFFKNDPKTEESFGSEGAGKYDSFRDSQ